MRRPSHCKHGHPLTEANLYYYPDSYRERWRCRACMREWGRKYRATHRAQCDARVQAWYETHREWSREYHREWARRKRKGVSWSDYIAERALWKLLQRHKPVAIDPVGLAA